MARTAPQRSLATQDGLLSWRRTALEVGIVSVVAARYLGEETHPWLALLGMLGVALALVLHASASRAYRDGDHVQRHAGRRHVALAAFVAAFGCAGLVWAIVVA